MVVYFSNDTDLEMSEYEPILTKVAGECLKVNGLIKCEPEISVTFIDNKGIRILNKRYRQIDNSTDVLSFPMFDSWRDWPKSGQETAIGDIVISVEKATAQSEAYGHSLARELGFLTAHSMLHLIGYDHMTEDDEKEMFGLQEEILIKAGLPR